MLGSGLGPVRRGETLRGLHGEKCLWRLGFYMHVLEA